MGEMRPKWRGRLRIAIILSSERQQQIQGWARATQNAVAIPPRSVPTRSHFEGEKKDSFSENKFEKIVYEHIYLKQCCVTVPDRMDRFTPSTVISPNSIPAGEATETPTARVHVIKISATKENKV